VVCSTVLHCLHWTALVAAAGTCCCQLLQGSKCNYCSDAVVIVRLLGALAIPTSCLLAYNSPRRTPSGAFMMEKPASSAPPNQLPRKRKTYGLLIILYTTVLCSCTRVL
jgi:hypothetical protein